jgi:hypothetical protein
MTSMITVELSHYGTDFKGFQWFTIKTNWVAKRLLTLKLKEEHQFYYSKQPFHGYVSITDNGLAYDNTIFTISKIKKQYY